MRPTACAFQTGDASRGRPIDFGFGGLLLEFGGFLNDPRLRRVHGGRGGSQRLTDLLDLSLGLGHGNFERARINAEQDLPCLDTSIVGNIDAYDTARDFGRHADNIGLYDRLR